MLKYLSPIVHQYDNKLYRVPLRRQGSNYTIYVADGFTREFDEDTLPDEVKTKMAMILSRGHSVVYDHELTELGLMSTVKDTELHDVGWRASESMFVIVLPLESLLELKGE
jgi:hypothetical protein